MLHNTGVIHEVNKGLWDIRGPESAVVSKEKGTVGGARFLLSKDRTP